GSLNIVGMNIERGPVVNDGVPLRGHGYHTHLRMLAEQFVTDSGPSAGVVKRDNHKIRQGSLYAFGDLRLFPDFPDNFDISLVRERCEYEFSHETRMIGHENPDSFFHYVLRVRLVSVHQVRPVSVPFFS